MSRAAVLALLATAASGSVVASDDAFESVSVGVAVLADAIDTRYHEFWTPEAGVDVFAETPFTAGRFRTGLHVFDNTAQADSLPSFSSRFAYVGWSIGTRLPAGIDVRAGTSLGSWTMRFVDAGVPGPARSESELATEWSGALQRRVTGGLVAELIARHRVVLTERRIAMTFVGASIFVRFDTPGWLRGFLDG